MNLSRSSLVSITGHPAPCFAMPLAGLAAVVVLLAAPLPARADDDASCAPLRQVESAMAHTNYRQTSTVDSRPPRHMISTPTAIYMQTPGGWISVAANPATRARLGHLLGVSLSDCHLLHAETVDGHAAEVYALTSHAKVGDKGTQIRIWLAKSSHLPLRSESDMHVMGKSEHVSARFEYDGVRAPANAQQMFDLERKAGGK